MTCIFSRFARNLSFLPFLPLSVSGQSEEVQFVSMGLYTLLLIQGIYELLDLRVSVSALLTFNKSEVNYLKSCQDSVYH